MPILKNAKKALRVSKRKTVINQQVRSRLKTASDAMKKEPTSQRLSLVYSAIDKAVKRNIIHKNKAAHLKSQFNAISPANAVAMEKVAPKKSAGKKAPAKAKKAVAKTSAKAKTPKKKPAAK